MDNNLFLQHLHKSSLEEGRAYMRAHLAEPGDPATIGKLLEDEALAQLFNSFVSLKLAELLIFFGEYTHHLSSHALGLKAKGDALVQIAHYHAAIECLDKAGEEFLQLEDERNWARSRISRIVASAWLGDVETALRDAALAREVFRRYGEAYWVCIVDHNLAVIYSHLGRYQDALHMYERMLEIYPTVSDQSEHFIKRAIAMAEVNRGLNLARLGKFEESYHVQELAREKFVALGEMSQVINIEIHLAELEHTQGLYGSALRRYYHAQDTLLQNNVDNPRLLAELKLQMANALIRLNRSHEACELARQAVEIYRQPDASLPTSKALYEYAEALVAAGRLKEAASTLHEAWTLFKLGGFDHHAAVTRLQLAEILLHMGSATEAYTEARLVKEYFEDQNLVVGRSVRAYLVMVGALIEQMQQDKNSHEKKQPEDTFQEAFILCRQAIFQAYRNHLQDEVYKGHYLLGRLFTLSGEIARAVRHYRAAIAQIERILNDLSYDLSPSFLHTSWIVYADIVTLYLQQGQTEQAFSYLERARSMALRQYLHSSREAPGERGNQENNASVLRTDSELKSWQGRYRRYSVLLTQVDTTVSPTVERGIIEAELKRCEAKISELFERLYLDQTETRTAFRARGSEKGSLKQLDVAQLHQRLAPDKLLLTYFLYKGRLVIFAVTPERLVTYEIPDGESQLERLLLFLHAHLQPRGWPNPEKPPQQAIHQMLNKLYQLLIAPVATLLPPTSGYLTIVPYGPLHTLPFHALYDGSKFLIENYQINYLPASSLLIQFDTFNGKQQRHSTQKEVVRKPPLIFGYSDHGHLPYALEEAKTLAAILGARCYLEDEATIAKLVEQVPGSPIVHLATHGHNRLDAPNFSSVIFADGQFNAIDAFGLSLQGCELVTLSGCETGLALSSGGDEQVGLGRAFLAAGADALVISLWPIEDSATNELMQLFYQHLLSGEGKAQALRAAQCSLIHRRDSIYPHPYYWAAFRLVGNVDPLKEHRTTDHSLALETRY